MLQGKVAVVTGSAIGIGRGVSVALARQGAKIAGLDIDPGNNADTARQVEAAGQAFLAVECDVGDKDKVRRAFDQILETFGRIDVLVNNAAVWDNSSLVEGSFETQTDAFDRAMGACAFGTYYCALAATPALIAAGGGNIVNLITEHVKPGHLITERPALGYDCAKFSQWRLTEHMAHELQAHNIRVNGLCFGATDTPMLRGVAPEIADAAMKVEDLGQAVLNVIAHGPDGPTGETYLFGTSGSARADSLKAIAALAPAA